jgi:serine/threonine protein kinase
VATVAPAAEQLLGGRYQVLKPLAKGGMAEVLLARTVGIKGFERYVVIKRIRIENGSDAKSIEMFLDEARLVASLHHRNIVQVHDVGEEDGKYFFAMEYVHGQDARSLLHHVKEKKQQLPLEHIITIVTGACAGLHYAHEQKSADWKPLGIVHRDISPGNILIGFDGSVKVVDFGIAKTELRQSEVTQAGEMKGKLGYMSPEQCRTQPIDRRTDTYLLGIVLYELATVKRLFKGTGRFEIMDAIVGGKFAKPSTFRKDLPKQLETIIMKALATKPEERYQTADDLRKDLEEFAVANQLHVSPTRLADYLRQQFGERVEPWLEADLPKAPEVVPKRDSAPVIAAPADQPTTDTPMSWPVDPAIARRRAWILGGLGMAAIVAVFAVSFALTVKSNSSDDELPPRPAPRAAQPAPKPPPPAPIDAGTVVTKTPPIDAAEPVVTAPPVDAPAAVKPKPAVTRPTPRPTKPKPQTGDDLDSPLPD